MKIIEGANQSGKTTTIFKEYNNADSVLIIPSRVFMVYGANKDINAEIVRTKDFPEQYSDYIDRYNSNEFNLRGMAKRLNYTEFIQKKINEYYTTFKDSFKNIVIDLDLVSEHFNDNIIDENNQLIITLINKNIEKIKEYIR